MLMIDFMMVMICAFVILFIIFLAFSPKKEGQYTPAQNAAGLTVLLFIVLPAIIFTYSYISTSIEESRSKKEDQDRMVMLEQKRVAEEKREEKRNEESKARALRDEMINKPNYLECARYADIAEIIQSKRNASISIEEQKKYLSYIRGEDYLPLTVWMTHVHNNFRDDVPSAVVQHTLLSACLPSLSEYAKTLSSTANSAKN